jgi:hypothetical protein
MHQGAAEAARGIAEAEQLSVQVPESAYLERPARQWPTVIGILAILWGGVGCLSGVWSLIAELAGVSPTPGLVGPLERAVGLLGLLIAGLLVVGGIQLLRRRPMGVQLIQAWIPLRLIVGLIGVGLLYRNRDAFEAATQEAFERQAEESSKRSGQPAPEIPPQMVTFMWGTSVACGGLAALIPPLVPALFVFGRRGREAMAEWSVPTSPWQPPTA